MSVQLLPYFPGKTLTCIVACPSIYIVAVWDVISAYIFIVPTFAYASCMSACVCVTACVSVCTSCLYEPILRALCACCVGLCLTIYVSAYVCLCVLRGCMNLF